MYPFRGVEGLDLDKSECRFIEETRIYTTVYKYVFNNNIKYYPVFLLKTEGAIYDMRMYATDEFKEFIESNGITGLRFEEIFDFED